MVGWFMSMDDGAASPLATRMKSIRLRQLKRVRMPGVVSSEYSTYGRERGMDDRVFVIQQVGESDSPERKRADEIYEGIIIPAVENSSLEAYRADLDVSPGAITPRMLQELLTARVVIADLTGRNPNVFYELGITHSFARPLISIADSSSSLPFDAKDERVIELGEYLPTGLGLRQGQKAIARLQESLRIVLQDDYVPPSPLRNLAANRSVDQLAPNDPLAAEMAQMRETLEDIRTTVTPRTYVPPPLKEDISVLREFIADNVKISDPRTFDMLQNDKSSTEQKAWVRTLRKQWNAIQAAKRVDDPWASDNTSGGYSDEPPF